MPAVLSLASRQRVDQHGVRFLQGECFSEAGIGLGGRFEGCIGSSNPAGVVLCFASRMEWVRFG